MEPKATADAVKVGTLTSGTIGFHFTQWAEGKAQRGRWTDKSCKQAINRSEKALGAFWQMPVARLRRHELIGHLEQADSIDTAGRVYKWTAEMFETLVDRGLLEHTPLGRLPEPICNLGQASDGEQPF